MTARERILARVNSIRATRADIAKVDPVSSHEKTNPVAAMSMSGVDQYVATFCARAAEEAATSECVATHAAVPQAVAAYLDQQGLERRVHVAGINRRDDVPINWSGDTDIEPITGSMAADGATLVSGCLAAIAEAGVVVTDSGSGYPNAWHYLAATHIVVLRAAQIVDGFEAFWRFARERFGSAPPRAINWIVGPSRTADLGVPSKLGAHGPARVHVIIVER